MRAIQVAAGIVIQGQQVLIARRHAHQHQGERWEFPGGKLEIGESPLDALKREMQEEVAIEVIEAEPFLTTAYTYPDAIVELHFFKVMQFGGTPLHQEDQVMRWVPMSELNQYAFPDANQVIVRALLSAD